ncbi:MAG: histidine phosphatase family protein [Verrucomicrobiales bacterium]|nr:histidine phosphatase family protein [Verrucomicrobiales bacterium]
MSTVPTAESYTIHLIRHPQTDWNAARRYQGLSNRPWSPAGASRAQQIVKKFQLAPFDHIISSPRHHARRLAEQLSEQVHQDTRWSEIDHGKWEGLTYQEVNHRFPDTVNQRFAAPLHCKSHGGQSLHELQQQVSEAWQQLIQSPSHQNIAILTHATPIQLILCHITGLPIERYWQFRIDCGSITSLDITAAGCIINFCNQT